MELISCNLGLVATRFSLGVFFGPDTEMQRIVNLIACPPEHFSGFGPSFGHRSRRSSIPAVSLANHDPVEASKVRNFFDKDLHYYHYHRMDERTSGPYRLASPLDQTQGEVRRFEHQSENDNAIPIVERVL